MLKDALAPNSHPMVDVAFNATNLWFAAQDKNWPLANYFFGETRNRLQWMVRMHPTVKAQGSQDMIDLKSTFDGINNGSMKAVQSAIQAKDSAMFTAAYRQMLSDCYSCHKAVGRPYMRPQIPTAPAQTIINTDPNATWPQ